MAPTTAYPLEIFYDGSCIVCSTEMDYYRRRNPQQRLSFTDISSADFDADQYDRTLQQFMAEMHVRDADGRYYVAVDAFLALWGTFPSGSLYRLFGTLVSLPGIHLVTKMGYVLFARYRHLLPKRTTDCESDTCNLNHPRS